MTESGEERTGKPRKKMIRVIYPKQSKTCALCGKMIPKYTATMFDPAKSKEKRYVHLKCWTDLQESRGIVIEEPPF